MIKQTLSEKVRGQLVDTTAAILNASEELSYKTRVLSELPSLRSSDSERCQTSSRIF